MNVLKALQLLSKNKMMRLIMNKGLHYKIPFNRPHGFWVDYINDDEVKVRIPFKSINKNHVGGIHACALATGCEYASGLALASNMDSSKFRYLLSSIRINYTYQAKSDIVVSVKRSSLQIDKLYSELSEFHKSTLDIHVKALDNQGNIVCECVTSWQIKSWDKVVTLVD